MDLNRSLRDQYLNRYLLAEKSYLRSLHVILVCFMHPMTTPDPDATSTLPVVSKEDINLVSIIQENH